MNFLKKSLVNILFTASLGIVNLSTSVILSRLLGPQGIGQYQLAVSSGTILSAVFTLGLGGSVIYFINHKMARSEIVTSMSLKFALFAGALTWLVLIFFLLWEHYYGSISLIARTAIGFYAFATVVITTVWPILMADLRVISYQLVALIPRVALFLSIVCFWFVGTVTLERAWLFTSLSQIPGMILMLFFLRRQIDLKLPFDWTLVKKMAGYGLKLNLSYIVLLLNGEIGLLLIRLLIKGDFSEVGYYRNAVSLATMILMLPNSIGPMLFARWSGAPKEEQKRQVEQVSRVFCLGSLLGLSAFVILAKPIVLTLYGNAFVPSVRVFQWMLAGVGARFIYNFLFRLFSANGKPLYTSFVLIVNLLVMVFLMILLVPSLKALGASIAFSVGNLVGMILSYYLAASRFQIEMKNCFKICREDIVYLYQMLKT